MCVADNIRWRNNRANDQWRLPSNCQLRLTPHPCRGLSRAHTKQQFEESLFSPKKSIYLGQWKVHKNRSENWQIYCWPVVRKHVTHPLVISSSCRLAAGCHFAHTAFSVYFGAFQNWTFDWPRHHLTLETHVECATSHHNKMQRVSVGATQIHKSLAMIDEEWEEFWYREKSVRNDELETAVKREPRR